MSRSMGNTKAILVVLSVIGAILVLESVVVSSVPEDLLVVQCKHQCKYDLNKKKCEDRCNRELVMEMEEETGGQEEDSFCKSFCKSFEGLYHNCMTVCPRQKSRAQMMTAEQQGGGGGGGFDGVANEAVCETSCSIIQERPLTIKCMRVCHERSPGAADSS